MKVLLAAGGSGGHIFPSVALAGELEKAGVEEIFFVSSKRKLDKNILGGVRHKCFFLSVNPMPLSFRPVRILKFVLKLFADVIVSAGLIVKLRPDVVVGFGGYSSGAIVAVAKVFGVPVMIHEQNYFPGRANRILSRIADRVAVSFKDSAEYFPRTRDKVVYSGNPLREGILRGNKEEAFSRLGLDPGKFSVLIMGGSQGSSFLNGTASESALRIKNSPGDAVQFIHLTGRNDYDRVKTFYEKNDIPGKVFHFLDRMEDAYAVCDLAVTRAGAAAVFELAYYAKPMILVPYPNPKNNQRSNAEYFSKAGAAIQLEEKDLTCDKLAGEILGLRADGRRRESIARAAGELGAPEAGKCLAQEVIKLAGSRTA
ncbi:MAG: undecaprenyldiphospho-muramoylpentapeptide beta-N-acetylglucosaminyltransferase [Candidatus Omnitrophota bacterium]